jgi:hypothetical protein
VTGSSSRARRRLGNASVLVVSLLSLGAPAAASSEKPGVAAKHPKASKRAAAPPRPKAARPAGKQPLPGLPKVAPLDYPRVRIQDFTDEELDLPYYLVHFHEVANGIDEQGPTRGYMRLGVWRGTQEPYNARVMENILSLAWFYTAKRPWNQYYRDPAVRARLEAALDFWCRSQAPDGSFTEYGPRDFSLSPTASSTRGEI